LVSEKIWSDLCKRTGKRDELSEATSALTAERMKNRGDREFEGDEANTQQKGGLAKERVA